MTDFVKLEVSDRKSSQHYPCPNSNILWYKKLSTQSCVRDTHCQNQKILVPVCQYNISHHPGHSCCKIPWKSENDLANYFWKQLT